MRGKLHRCYHFSGGTTPIYLVLFGILVGQQIEPVAGFAAARQRRTNKNNDAIRSNSNDQKGFGCTKSYSKVGRANNNNNNNNNTHAAITKRNKQQREQRDFSTTKKASRGGAYVPDTSDTTLKFLDFLNANECEGIEVLEIGFDTKTGLRGIFCKEPICAGEFICAIPFVSTLLVNETMTTTASTATPSSSSSPSDILSASQLENGLYFLQRFWKNEEQHQRWKPYFDCLPKTDRYDPNFNPTPDFWTPEEICQLQIPSLVDPILARKQGLEVLATTHDNLHDTVMTLEELQHAAWLIQTRAFTTFQKVLPNQNVNNDNNNESNDNNHKNKRVLRLRTVLIPFLDFINHSSDDKTTNNNNNNNAQLQVVETKEYDESFYALQATRNIPAGHEIRICYGAGQETFLDLFAKYGFLVPPGKKDQQRLQRSGLDTTCFTTTLEEDEEEFATTPRSSTRARILEIRICVKRLLEKKTKRRGQERKDR